MDGVVEEYRQLEEAGRTKIKVSKRGHVKGQKHASDGKPILPQNREVELVELIQTLANRDFQFC